MLILSKLNRVMHVSCQMVFTLSKFPKCITEFGRSNMPWWSRSFDYLLDSDANHYIFVYINFLLKYFLKFQHCLSSSIICFKILFRNNYWYDTLACNMNCLSLKADFQLRKSIIGLLTEKVQAMYQSSFVFSHCLAETTIMQPFVSGICVIHQLMFGFDHYVYRHGCNFYSVFCLSAIVYCDCVLNWNGGHWNENQYCVRCIIIIWHWYKCECLTCSWMNSD